MWKKFYKDLNEPKQFYQLAEDITSSVLCDYYFIFDEEKLKAGYSQKFSFDEEGIPIIPSYVDVKNATMLYYPISIGQYGLSIFNTYLKTKSEEDKKRFMKIVKWFYEHCEIDERLGARWLTYVELPSYHNPGPWQSAFSQARGINILLRGYQLTGEKKYFDIAEQALIPFEFPVSEGGVTNITKWGAFYEEYTAEMPTLVLNGMIFALCGIYDFVRIAPENKKAQHLYEQGINTLRNILEQYDLGYWTRYNLCKADFYPKLEPSTILYQRLHIVQLQLLYRLTNFHEFKYYIERWQKQDTLFNAIRMYILKFRALRHKKIL